MENKEGNEEVSKKSMQVWEAAMAPLSEKYEPR